jgi:transglutaminase-like putative cysteine protease
MIGRRQFLAHALSVFPLARVAASDGWRTFAVTTRVVVQRAANPTRIWIPLAYARGGEYQRVLTQRWKGNAPVLRAVRDEHTGVGSLFAEWSGEARPEVEVTLTVATRDRATDWSSPTARREPSAALQQYLRPTRLMPLDGIVRETAMRITRAETTDVGKARAIYEWIVENTVRDPAIRGCGLGDIRAMLETRNLRGKCADLNALFVGLARAAGVPARDVYGVRVAPSRRFASLGKADDVTTAQHCRAEFHSARHGWVPVDPADVRKVILEEKPGLDLSSTDVQYARRLLFGGWEMNWIAFNDARDVRLPQSSTPPLPFFMYPHGETGGRRLDSLDPQGFHYQITARVV